MKLLKSAWLASILLALVVIGPAASAATSPDLGAAGTFVILSGTYSNSAPGTTINGDLGYTTQPVVAPTVNGTTHAADTTYNQAGIDQGVALGNLASQPCTFTFASGAVDLASDTTHGPVGVYTPGVYCIDGAASIGGGGTVTLNGAGTYIFRMVGALTTSANSRVVRAGGASACDVWWTPTQATTLGANSSFAGIDIDASGIAIGDNVKWLGRALAFGGTVSTVRDTISAPTCTEPDDVVDTVTPPTGGGSGSGEPNAPGAPNAGVAPRTNSLVWGVFGFMIAGVSSLAIYAGLRKKA